MEQPTIVFCVPGKTFSRNFLISWTALFAHLKNLGYKPVLSSQYSPVVYWARSSCLGGDVLQGKNQKPWQGKLKYDYIMWIDSDMVFQIDDFTRMLDKMQHLPEVQVLAGPYLMEDRVHTTVVKNWDEAYFQKHGTFQFLKISDLQIQSYEVKSPLIKVDYTGMGWMLMKKGVIEQLEYPWFKPHFHNIGNAYDFSSEDVGFCHDLKEKNIDIWVDTTIKVGHEKQIIV